MVCSRNHDVIPTIKDISGNEPLPDKEQQVMACSSNHDVMPTTEDISVNEPLPDLTVLSIPRQDDTRLLQIVTSVV